jgi:hypothetical protein
LLKKGAILDDEDDEDDDNPLPPRPLAGPSTSRIFARTTSARSRASPSPAPATIRSDSDNDMLAGPSFKVNNNSTLLASPMKRKRERSAFDDDAFDISGDSLDVLPPAKEDYDDGSSDLEILEPASGKGKGRALSSTSSASTLRPLASHPSLSNALPSSFASSNSASSRFISGWAAANAPKTKPTLSQSKADQYLPAFAKSSGTGGQGTLEFGQKKRPKVTKAVKKK